MSTVSIVIPAYNHARFLAQAIESVLKQTYPAVELVVLDDGSTDDTRSVLEHFGQRFRWESQANMGQAATLNKGWAMTTGNVLGYLSADDFLHPDAAARAVAALEADHRLVAVYPDFEQVDEASCVFESVRAPEFNYAEMLMTASCPPGPGAFFLRSAYQQVGGWDVSLRRIPDFEFWLRLGRVGPLGHIPEVLASYRVHRGAQSFSPVDPPRAEEIIRVIDAVFESSALPYCVTVNVRAARANARLHAARLHLMSHRAGSALYTIGSAFMIDPAVVLRLSSYRLIASGVSWHFRSAK